MSYILPGLKNIPPSIRWWIWAGSGLAAALLLTGYFWGFSDDPELPSAAKTVLREKTFSISLDGRGVLRGVGPLDAVQRDMLRVAMQSRSVRLPEETGRAAPSATDVLVYPVGTVILEEQPVLSWRPVSGAKSYEVIVRDESSGRTASSGSTTATEFKLKSPLRHGNRYVWQVRAKLAGGGEVYPKAPAPPARFRVADAAFLDVVKGLPKSLTLRGVVFAEAGLLDAARTEFEELRRMNPQSLIVAAWIEQIDRAKHQASPMGWSVRE